MDPYQFVPGLACHIQLVIVTFSVSEGQMVLVNVGC